MKKTIALLLLVIALSSCASKHELTEAEKMYIHYNAMWQQCFVMVVTYGGADLPDEKKIDLCTRLLQQEINDNYYGNQNDLFLPMPNIISTLPTPAKKPTAAAEG